jgi:hypothetical protein
MVIPDPEGKLWTPENILLLISLYEKFAKTFEKCIKKTYLAKICYWNGGWYWKEVHVCASGHQVERSRQDLQGRTEAQHHWEKLKKMAIFWVDAWHLVPEARNKSCGHMQQSLWVTG